MDRMLIIGGAGFVGANLARRAVERGERPHLAIGPTTDIWRLEGIEDQVEIHRLVFSDQRAVQACVDAAQAQRIYYLAARTKAVLQNPIEEVQRSLNEDLQALFTFVNAAANAKTPPQYFIRAGSLAEYGAAPPPYRERDCTLPLTIYGAALSSGTKLLHALKDRLPFAPVSLCLALVYGPQQSTSFLIPNMIEKLGRGEPVHIRNPEAIRDLIYIDDALDALEMARRLPDGVDKLNICTGKAPTMQQVAEIIIAATDSNPALVTFGDGAHRDGADTLIGNGNLADELYGWRPKVSLEEGLALTVAAWKARAQ